MKFTKQYIEDVYWTSEYVQDECYETSRWLEHRSMVFEHEGKFYRLNYDRGLTEIQDHGFLEEYDGDEVECEEVVPVEKTITVYKAVK